MHLPTLLGAQLHRLLARLQAPHLVPLHRAHQLVLVLQSQLRRRALQDSRPQVVEAVAEHH
jgi:hypothetical protein